MKNQTTDARSLFDFVIRPLVALIEPAMTDTQRSAFASAPLLIFATRPPRCQALGFGVDGPIDCGVVDLPAPAAAALGRFIEAGLNSVVDRRALRKLTALLEGEKAELTVSVRLDQGVGRCYLLPEGDLAPVMLFACQPEAAQVH
jgi:hypothetical protein